MDEIKNNTYINPIVKYTDLKFPKRNGIYELENVKNGKFSFILKKHPYLMDSVCVERLIEEYNKHKSLVVAYDLDNTVKDYHQKGHDYSEVIELIKESKDFGFYLIVFTAEEDTEKVKMFLNENTIPYDAINENPPFWKSNARKIYYNILLDDRAGLSAAFNILKKVLEQIKINKNK
jgi:hypothetical protein